MLLVILGLFGVVTALLVHAMSNTTSAALRRDQSVATAFAGVKCALIGWSAARDPATGGANARPGELPCPDMNNDGSEDGNCAAGAIGRVPWKTLGIPEPKDAAGETLWYAIAGPFRTFDVNGNPIHSDTKGNITVYQDSTASTITTEAIAVLFAPGAALGAQNRDTAATALCPTTGTTIAMNLCAANYLETAAGVNNATTNGPFISAQSSGTFNDKVMAITTADLMPIVEQRVARELRAILISYKAAVGEYPWADCSDGISDLAPNRSNRGRIPSLTAETVQWGVSGAPALPNWFFNQGATTINWGHVIYYSAGKNFLQGGGASCSTCEVPGTGSPPSDGTLAVNGVFGKEVVIITTGPAGATRPQGGIGSGLCSQAHWSAYLEDSQNNKQTNDRYVTPSSTAYARDRLYTIP